MNKKFLKKILKKASKIRLDILDICYKKSGHVATSFSCTELLCYLYYTQIVKFKKKNHLIISKGHCSELVYSILKDIGLISKDLFDKNYSSGRFKLGEHLSNTIPGVEFSTGALGHGLPFACGKAFALKKNYKNDKVFVLTGDAEFCEGSMWESLLFAVQQKLSNLIIMVDYNKIGSLDYLKNTAPISKFFKSLDLLGLKKIVIKNANNFLDIDKCFKKILNNRSPLPKIILCNTIKGYGVKIFENDPIWHVKKISEVNYNLAKEYLINN